MKKSEDVSMASSNQGRPRIRSKKRTVPKERSGNAIDPDAIHNIALNQIRTAPWNPPGRMDPETIEELAANIGRHGQQVPALVRPIEGEAPIMFELVFGHRRYAAISRLAPPVGAGTIKTFVRSLSD